MNAWIFLFHFNALRAVGLALHSSTGYFYYYHYDDGDDDDNEYDNNDDGDEQIKW